MTRRTWHEDRMVHPRLSPGVDHGSAGVALAELRRGNEVAARLVWLSGCRTAACGVRGFGSEYVPARLRLVDRNGFPVVLKDMVTGGRLTIERIAASADLIDGAMGEGTTAALDLSRTLVVVEDPS